jgi:hypothetical protein
MYWGAVLGLAAAVAVVVVGGSLVVIAMAAWGAACEWLDDRYRRRRLASLPVTQSRTAWMGARNLQRGATVLTPSTPYRYRVERVLWLEKLPLAGPVVAALEGQDPDTLEIQQRWHKWAPDDHVIAFTADVDPAEGQASDEVGKLYGRFSHTQRSQFEDSNGLHEQLSVADADAERDIWPSMP